VKEYKIKIAFIVGSSEQGMDGVGDYTRLFAEDLSLEGENSLIISIKESIKESSLEKINEIWYLKIPKELSAKEKVKIIKLNLNKFNPEWISFQFVPYIFHHKGIPIQFFNKLSFTKKYKVHFMFHELWIGNDHNYKFGNFIVGSIQKAVIKLILRTYKPQLITTSTEYYQNKLKEFNARIHPIFGNINLNKENKRFMEVEPQKINVILFGGLSADTLGFEKQLLYLFRLFPISGHLVIFHFIGKHSILFKEYSELIDVYFSKKQIIQWGYLSEENISSIFQQAQIGISRAPLELAGKSGTTLAMLEHGIPVLLKPSKKNTITKNRELRPYQNLILSPNLNNVFLPEKIKYSNQRIVLRKTFLQYLNE
jgi:hypothetical protein